MGADLNERWWVIAAPAEFAVRPNQERHRAGDQPEIVEVAL
jgi:hypothetical protein